MLKNAYKAFQKYVDKSSKAIKHFNKRIIPKDAAP